MVAGGARDALVHWHGSAGVVFGDRREGGFRFPGHVGVGVAVATVEDLDDADAIVDRCEAMDRLTAWVLAASVGAAARVALRQWLQAASAPSSTKGFVVPSGSLPTLMRAALTPLALALDAAATDSPRQTGPTQRRDVATPYPPCTPASIGRWNGRRFDTVARVRSHAGR